MPRISSYEAGKRKTAVMKTQKVEENQPDLCIIREFQSLRRWRKRDRRETCPVNRYQNARSKEALLSGKKKEATAAAGGPNTRKMGSRRFSRVAESQGKGFGNHVPSSQRGGGLGKG